MTPGPSPDEDLVTVPRPTGESLAAGAVGYRLVVVRGPDQGATLELNGSEPSRLLLGQGPACHLRLSDPLVSRRHAALEVSNGRARLADLDSTNGTTVNGVLVADAFLQGGEVIRIGETILRVDPVRTEPVALPGPTSFGRLVGSSPEMRRLFPLCETLAASAVPVLIEGESGTGKEALAEAIHVQGARANAPFVVFDCTTTPSELAEVVLFGRADSRKGALEQAERGTIFIDEIGDLGVDLQGRLLRVLERGDVQRAGASGWIRVDVRVIASTRRDPDKDVQSGRLRDDLFDRLAVTRIELAPLRKRHGDVSRLAEHFWRELTGDATPLPGDFLPLYDGYEWPGNVRELEGSVVRRLMARDGDPRGPRTDSGAVESASSGAPAPRLPAFLDALDFELPLPRARQRVVEAFEREYVARVLARHGGNIGQAAAASGIARRYFQLIRARLSR